MILLKDLPLFVLAFTVVMLPISYFYSQVRNDNKELGVILVWLSGVAMSLVTMWVYQFFKWPPTLTKVFLLSIQVLMTGEVLFVIGNTLLNLNKLNVYLQTEIFIIKWIQLLVSILAPLAAYHFISYDVANMIGIISLAVIWIKISYEVVSLKYG